MVTAKGVTAKYLESLDKQSLVEARMDDANLVLVRRDRSDIDVGSLKGLPGVNNGIPPYTSLASSTTPLNITTSTAIVTGWSFLGGTVPGWTLGSAQNFTFNYATPSRVCLLRFNISAYFTSTATTCKVVAAIYKNGVEVRRNQLPIIAPDTGLSLTVSHACLLSTNDVITLRMAQSSALAMSSYGAQFTTMFKP